MLTGKYKAATITHKEIIFPAICHSSPNIIGTRMGAINAIIR